MTLAWVALSRYRYRRKVLKESRVFFLRTSGTSLSRQRSRVGQIGCYDGRDAWVDSGKLDTVVGVVFFLLPQVPSTCSSPPAVDFATVHQ